MQLKGRNLWRSLCADLWKQAYDDMLDTIRAAETAPNDMITKEIVDLIGSSAPPLLMMSAELIEKKLANNTLDIGMCGFLISIDSLDKFDFVNPFYLSSGIQAVVTKPRQVPTFFDVLNAITGSVDSKAQLIILIIIFFVYIFGHLVVAAESLVPGQNYRTGYLESTQDGMWFGLIVMSTVGFGDVYPRTMLGRFITIVWMFVSISLMGMLLAIITNQFLGLQLIAEEPTYSIVGLSDLSPFTVVTASSYAYSVVMRSVPGTKVTLLPPTAQAEVFRSVLNGTYQVLICATKFTSSEFGRVLMTSTGRHRAPRVDPVLQQPCPRVQRPPDARRIHLQHRGRLLRREPARQ